MEDVPFRRRSRLGGQIHSIKHIVDVSGALAGAGQSVSDLATAVITRSATFNLVEVELSETVNGFFISLFVIGATGSGLSGPIDWYIAKARAGQTTGGGGTFPVPGNTGLSDVRNQIFHEEKGLSGSADGTPMAFKGVIVVPRGMRRMREGDKFFIALRSADNVNDANFCVKAIYKSFS